MLRAVVPIPDQPPLSVAQYAKHRGVTPPTVYMAIKKGRLSLSIANGKIIDVALADQEWAANTDLNKAPAYVKDRARLNAVVARPPHETTGGPAPQGSIADASAREKHWKAVTAEINAREAAGELVKKADVRQAYDSVFLACRSHFLGIPTRLRQLRPHLTLEDLAALEALVREALEALAHG